MFNSQFIEVGIGIVFIFLLMSILVSGIHELIASFFSHRGKQLKEAILHALQDPSSKDWAAKLYKHPLIDTLRKSEKRLPAYISSDSFARALIEIITQEAAPDGSGNIALRSNTDTVNEFIKGLNTLKAGDTKTLLGSFVSASEGNYEKLKGNIENWYEEYMNRVSGWYKKKTKTWLMVIGLLAAILMNVDTIHISQQLWENSVLRTSLVNAVDAYVPDSSQAKGANKSFSRQVNDIRKGYNSIEMLHLPIGWVLTEREEARIEAEEHSSYTGRYFGILRIFTHKIGLSKIIGWIFTAIAVSFGAPIWFDMLNKLINLRNTGLPQEGKKQ
ncbi:MAG: hypothetical protein ACHQRM_15255 [Bacteroidia bacterium]